MVVGTERGGVFHSESSAQVLLLPHNAEVGNKEQHTPEVLAGEAGFPPAVLSSSGRVGDLLATKTGDEPEATGTLWFCSKGTGNSGEAEWREVLLGPPFEGLG